jgi:carbon monoxide dehydrogenase subunit G
MKFENSFDVEAPIDEVYATLLDLDKIAPAMPGAQVTDHVGDDAYKVAIKVKVGPMSMTYKGEVQITDRDPESHTAKMKARAKESRGQGTADADVTMALTGGSGRTSANVKTEVKLTGRVATMGRGVLQDVSGRLVATFADNLAKMLEQGEPAGPPEEAVQEESGQPESTNGAKGTPPASPPPPRSAPPPPADDALDLGQIGGAVVAERAKDPRVLAVLGFLLVLFLLRRARR